MCSNGDVVKLAPGPAEIVDELPQGRLYRDGRLIIDGESRTVADRRRLGFVGVVSVAFTLDAKGTLVGAPMIESIGIPELAADGRRLDDVALEAASEAVESLPRARRRDPDSRRRRCQAGGARGRRGPVGQEAVVPYPRFDAMMTAGCDRSSS
jgi:ribonuclease J